MGSGRKQEADLHLRELTQVGWGSFLVLLSLTKAVTGNPQEPVASLWPWPCHSSERKICSESKFKGRNLALTVDLLVGN